MIFFTRNIEDKIRSNLFKKNIVIIYGPRQSGKTTLSKRIVQSFGDDGMYYDCQLQTVRKHFVVGEPEKLLEITKGKKIVVFDEAQTIQNIGTILKVFHDTYPGVQVLATGSSSFDLANKIVEPMTGRAIEFTLLPLSIEEIKSVMNIERKDIYMYLKYGMYPAVVAAATEEDKKEEIKKIATNYLYKDIFTFEQIKRPKAFEDILKMLALQIGQLVSVNEIAKSAQVSRETVDRYLRLLEQSFIIKRIYSFSNNPRKEIKKAFKVVFLDLGVRNAIVDIITDIEKRKDKGSLFENFYITERMKVGTLDTFPSEIMFWRDRTGLEIDVIEKSGQSILAVECKWSNEDVSFKKFLKLYPEAETRVVTLEYFLNNILK